MLSQASLGSLDRPLWTCMPTLTIGIQTKKAFDVFCVAIALSPDVYQATNEKQSQYSANDCIWPNVFGALKIIWKGGSTVLT